MPPDADGGSPALDAAKPPRFRWRTLVSRIAADIQAGRLASGTWLKQIDLEQDYGCSRGDVRKALDELVARRLAQHVPNRGYQVVPLDAELVTHLGELRSILEGAVADLIYDRADDAALAQLAMLVARFEEQVRTGANLLDRHATNQDFHLKLLTLCPNPELSLAVRGVRDRSPSSLLYQWRTEGWIEQSLQDHAAIVAALRAKDRAMLREAMVRHVRVNQRASSVMQALGRKDVPP